MPNLQIQEKYFAGFALSLHCETFPFHRGSPSLISKLAMIHIIGNASALQKYEICIFEPAPYLYIFSWSNVALYVEKIWKYFFIVIYLTPPVWLISKINWFNGFDVDFDVYDKFDLNCDHKNDQILFMLLNISCQEIFSSCQVILLARGWMTKYFKPYLCKEATSNFLNAFKRLEIYL